MYLESIGSSAVSLVPWVLEEDLRCLKSGIILLEEGTLRYECNIVYGLIWIPITLLCFLLISECWLACLGG